MRPAHEAARSWTTSTRRGASSSPTTPTPSARHLRTASQGRKRSPMCTIRPTAAPADSSGPAGTSRAIPPAVAGQQVDLATFQVCCRLVRGIALTDDEALAAIQAWNASCRPPGAERELRWKLSSAGRSEAQREGAGRRAAGGRPALSRHQTTMSRPAEPRYADARTGQHEEAKSPNWRDWCRASRQEPRPWPT